MKMGFAEVLTLLFVVLKVAEVVTWSWWIVFSPVIVAYSIILLIFFVGLLVAVGK